MSLPIPSAPKDPNALRVSDGDRDRVVEALRVAAGDGRLSLEELEDRIEAAMGARTHADLAPLVADLPDSGGGPHGSVAWPAGVLAVPPKEVMRVHRSGGSVRYEGRWSVPKRLELDLRGGSARLDFTAAIVAGPVTEVAVRLHGGSLRMIVPPGFVVEEGDTEVHGGTVRDRTRGRAKGASASAADAPVTHRIVISGEIHGGSIRIYPPSVARERSLRRFLLRRRAARRP